MQDLVHPALTDEHDGFRGWVREFAERELRPLAAALDDEETFPTDQFRAAASLGLLGVTLPVDYGGAGLDIMSAAIMREELARVSPAFAAIVVASSIYFGMNVSRLGTEEQKRRYLPAIAAGEKIGAWALTESGAGSDARHISTSTRRDGDRLLLRGSKTFITNGPVADYVIVQTRRMDSQETSNGTAVIVERGMRGFSSGPAIEKLGYRGSPTGDLAFDDVEIDDDHILGADGEALTEALNALDLERVLVLFSGLGILQACLDEMVSYATVRTQFGRPIADFQLIKEKIALAAASVDVIRTYGYNLVWRLESGLPVRKQAAIGKYMVAEAAMHCAIDAVQVHGGYGYIKASPVERLFRDAKLIAIGGGTTEMQKLTIARLALADGPTPGRRQ